MIIIKNINKKLEHARPLREGRRTLDVRCVPCNVTILPPQRPWRLQRSLQRHWPCHCSVPCLCNGPWYLFNVTNPAPDRSWYLFHVTNPAPERSWCLFHVTLLAPDRSWYLFYVTNPAPDRSWYLFQVTNPAPERSWYLFHVTNPAPERSWYLCNVTNPAPERSWYLINVTNPAPETSFTSQILPRNDLGACPTGKTRTRPCSVPRVRPVRVPATFHR